MADFRVYTAGLEADFFKRTTLTTSNNAESELWNLLKMPARVRDSQFDIPGKHGLRSAARKELALTRYSGFIEQAHANWKAAKHGDFHSNPLLYYYCFLNLAKAELVLSNPDLDEHILHGIKVDNRSLPEEFNQIEVKTTNGVFHAYYSSVFNQAPLTLFKFQNIIEYLQEMSFQVEYGNFGKSKAIPYRHRIVTGDSQMWSVVAINKNAHFSVYSESYENFFSHYELAENTFTLTAAQAQVLGTNFTDWKGYDIFQSKLTTPLGDRDSMLVYLVEVENIFKFSSTFSIYDTPDSGVFNVPPLDNSALKLNEEISIYLLMFLLSTLVRYNPSYYSEVLSTKYGYFIENFTETCPERFLKHITNRIFDANFLISQS